MDNAEDDRMTPLKAIREYCVQNCASGSVKEARLCEDTDCTLHFYRMGKNPARAGVGVVANVHSLRKKPHSTADFLKGSESKGIIAFLKREALRIALRASAKKEAE